MVYSITHCIQKQILISYKPWGGRTHHPSSDKPKWWPTRAEDITRSGSLRRNSELWGILWAQWMWENTSEGGEKKSQSGVCLVIGVYKPCIVSLVYYCSHYYVFPTSLLSLPLSCNHPMISCTYFSTLKKNQTLVPVFGQSKGRKWQHMLACGIPMGVSLHLEKTTHKTGHSIQHSGSAV